jgi:DNA (cytosine-5)-methyltransferase 1
LKIGSLFSGIGGLELGLEWAGLGHTVWQVESDEFCRGVLARHWPGVKQYNDVRTVGASNLESVDLICGGFPCQDISNAGKGAGLSGARSGLWWEFARILEEVKPPWVVIENVASGANRWVDAVRRELERLGYKSFPIPLSARAVGAPHRRARVFIIAADPNGGGQHSKRLSCILNVERKTFGNYADGCNSKESHTYPWSPKHGVCSVDDGIPAGVVEGRMTPTERAKLRALGNAVVPQCAQVVGEFIKLIKGDTSNEDTV